MALHSALLQKGWKVLVSLPAPLQVLESHKCRRPVLPELPLRGAQHRKFMVDRWEPLMTECEMGLVPRHSLGIVKKLSLLFPASPGIHASWFDWVGTED